MYKLFCLNIIFLTVMSNLSIVKANEKSNAEDILNKYEQNITLLNTRIAFDSETKEIYEGDYNWELFYKENLMNATTWRNGEKFDIKMTQQFTRLNNNPKQAKSNTIRMMYVNEGMRYDCINDQPIQNLNIENNDPDSYKVSIGMMLGAGYFLDGFAPNYSYSLPDVMREGGLHIKDKMETIDGHKTYVLEARNKYGTKTVWIDPEYGYNARRILMQYNSEDMYYDEILGTSPEEPLPPAGSTKWPVAPIDSKEILVESIQIENIDGVFMPISAAIHESTSFSTGEVIKTNTIHKRTNISLNPDFEAAGAFVMDVPDGTFVNYFDDRDTGGVQYEWFNGKPRAQIDDLFIDSLNEQVDIIKNEKVEEQKEIVESNEIDHAYKMKNINGDEPQRKISLGTDISSIHVLLLIALVIIVIAIIKFQLLRK